VQYWVGKAVLVSRVPGSLQIANVDPDMGKGIARLIPKPHECDEKNPFVKNKRPPSINIHKHTCVTTHVDESNDYL
jgi:hypothetical protein